MSKKLEVEGLFDLRFASDPQISADGKLVACVVSWTQEDRKGYESAVYLSRNGAPAARFTGGKKDSSPRFSPDGSHLAFLSARGEEKPQLCLMPVSGGEARVLTKLKSGVSAPRFSRDGRRIAFLSRGDWVDEAAKNGLPRVVTDLRYKQNGLPGAGVMPEEPLALWVCDLESERAELLMRFETDIEGFDWVDGERLVFVAARDPERGAEWSSNAFLVRPGKKKAKQLTRWSGAMTAISVSPDGQRAAVFADPDFATQPGDLHLYTFSLLEGASPVRLGDFDAHAGQTVNSDAHLGAYPAGPFWQDDGSLLCLHQLGGAGVVTRVTAEGTLETVTGPRDMNIPAFAATRSGAVAYLAESLHQPLELYLKPGRTARRVSSFNPDHVAPATEFAHLRLERDGFTIEGWVLKPSGWKAKKRYPVVLNIHGGPATAWGPAYMHEFQLLAAQGYAVAFCNIRGSTGYGDAQTAGTLGQYFQGDYADLMAFLDACLERFSWLDAERCAVVGGSYGGVMTNWVISHTERFRAAITDRCISNWISFSGTSDIGYRFTPREIRGVVPEDADRLWEMSPLKHAASVKTPCLIVHSEEDHRCPIEQAEQWFVALKTHGVSTRFVRVPGENHDLSRSGRPDRRAARLHEYLDWLERWL